MTKIESIILIGMAGVGKSTIGRLLAREAGFDFVDLDDYILTRDGKRPQEIIDALGEEAFLDLEERRMCELDLANKVVSPGGSIVYHPDLMVSLKQKSIVVYLADSFENIEGKLTDVSHRGIVGLKGKSLRQIYDERRPLYARYAHITVDCQGKSDDQIVPEILRLLDSVKDRH